MRKYYLCFILGNCDGEPQTHTTAIMAGVNGKLPIIHTPEYTEVNATGNIKWYQHLHANSTLKCTFHSVNDINDIKNILLRKFKYTSSEYNVHKHIRDLLMISVNNDIYDFKDSDIYILEHPDCEVKEDLQEMFS